MAGLTMFEKIIDKKLGTVHTAFLARVITAKGTTADIQPLLTNAPILINIPVIQNARYKLTEQEIRIDGNSFTNLVKTPLRNRDVVVCICSENNISSAKKGEMPSMSEPTQKHSLTNSIIVGIL